MSIVQQIAFWQMQQQQRLLRQKRYVMHVDEDPKEPEKKPEGCLTEVLCLTALIGLVLYMVMR